MAEKEEFILFGDVEGMVVDLLSNSPRLSAESIDRITTDMVGFTQGMTWIEIAMEGGSYKFLHTKRARIDITVYSVRRKDAYRIASICQAIMFANQRSYKGFGLNYQSCQVETDIFKGTEKDTSQVRYIQSLRLLVLPYNGP